MVRPCPDRIVVAGLGGDSGKSLVSIGLICVLRHRGLTVAPFKKGPDFIDAAWLGRAAGSAGRNLDTYLMSEDAILTSVAAADADIAVVEGNRGLFDGMTASGDHATSTLARLIDAPVLLVVDITKVTRTVAAMVKGCQLLETGVRIGGVVLNRVATRRQEAIVREAVETETGVPVMGAIYRAREPLLPSRHLGLLTATEHPDAAKALETAADLIANQVDVDAVLDLAGNTRALPVEMLLCPGMDRREERAEKDGGAGVRIGVLKDKAFSFYYPENLEALVRLGAELVYLSPISDSHFPDEVDGLYAGGGFPEMYAQALARNRAFRASLLKRIEAGLPVFAECGGLMYLARVLMVDGHTYPMVGALPVDVAQRQRPKGHGYVSARIDGETPFFETGISIRGHEFHYSEIVGDTRGLTTVATLEKGVGIGQGRDGIAVRNVTAFYTHFHALGVTQWASGFLSAVLRSK
jgi:cobyrinic acid a,c-diamide synthase